MEVGKHNKHLHSGEKARNMHGMQSAVGKWTREMTAEWTAAWFMQFRRKRKKKILTVKWSTFTATSCRPQIVSSLFHQSILCVCCTIFDCSFVICFITFVFFLSSVFRMASVLLGAFQPTIKMTSMYLYIAAASDCELLKKHLLLNLPLNAIATCNGKKEAQKATSFSRSNKKLQNVFWNQRGNYLKDHSVDAPLTYLPFRKMSINY